MCSHYKRFVEGFQLIEQVTNPTHVYFDELHHYISSKIRKSIEHIHEYEHVLSILGLTATPQSILLKRGIWSKITLIKTDTDLSNYSGIRDVNFVPVDHLITTPYTPFAICEFKEKSDETIHFIKGVLEDHPELFNSRVRCFIPAHVIRSGHKEVSDLLFEKCNDVVVVIINSKDKTLRFQKNGKIYEISVVSVDKEVCERIGEILTQYDLLDRPLFITGFLCVGMGQTLTHSSYGTFTHAIISHFSVNTVILYQLMGRITGRTKKWDTYSQTTLFCPTPIYDFAIQMEKITSQIHHKITLYPDDLK